jgi:hypothetical protein
MNGSLRRGVPSVSERPGSCVACRHKRHRECDLRLNEDAVDAQDFVDVSCKCPCEGEVTGQLIDLVSALRAQLGSLNSVITEAQAQEADELLILRSLVTNVEEFFQNSVDDEGSFDLGQLHELEEKLAQFRMGVYEGE